MVPQIRSVTDRILCHFGPFFAASPPSPPSPPQTTQKIKIFGNIKKPPGDIICLFLKLNFVCRQKWVGRKVASMKKTFTVIFDPTWTHILAQKGPNKEFLKQHFSQKRPKLYLYQFCDFKTD